MVPRHGGHIPLLTGRKLQPAKSRDAPDGVCEGVGCARCGSHEQRETTHEMFSCTLKLRTSSTKELAEKRSSGLISRKGA